MPSAASGASGAVFLCSLISFVALGDAAYAQQGDLVHFTFGAEQQKFGQKTDRSRKTRSSRKNYRLRKSPPKNLIGSRIKRPRSLSAKTLHKRVSGRRALATTHRKKGRAASDSWERFFGGNKRETSFSIAAFPDGSTISAGYTRSKGNGNADILLLRLGADGKLIWQKTYGGKARDMATSVAILPDGGFVTASISQSGTKNQGNALIMRHDKKGKLVWSKTFGGEKYDIPYAIKVDHKGRILVAGYTKSSGVGDADGWVFCLSGKGEIQWERTFGTSGRDWLRAMAVFPDGRIAVAGGTKADKKADTYSWVLQLDQNGKKIWEKTYRASENVARAIIPLANGNLAIAGWAHEKGSITGRDIWIAKLDPTGKKIWEKKLGGSGDDHTEALIALPNGHIALAGGTTKNLAVITVRAAWMLRLNEHGKLMWRRSFEGKSDQIYSLSSLPGGKIVAAGASWRRNKGSDAWILTVDKHGRRGRTHAGHLKRTRIQ
ncbi:MAG: hypothetical protein L3J67_11760 [Hyphomicrobiaceae bacterium]|nr:hypothetical protein [Hyphomicrobiaceae bacterium]